MPTKCGAVDASVDSVGLSWKVRSRQLGCGRAKIAARFENVS